MREGTSMGSCTLKGRGVSRVTPDDAHCQLSPGLYRHDEASKRSACRAWSWRPRSSNQFSHEISKDRCRSCQPLRPQHTPGPRHHRSPCSQSAEVPFGNATARETRPPPARTPGPLRMTKHVEDVVILHVNCSHHPLFSSCLSLAARELEAPCRHARAGLIHRRSLGAWAYFDTEYF